MPIFANEDFIVKENKNDLARCSKNTLKEKLGEVVKNTVSATTTLCSTLGKIKVEFAPTIANKSCSAGQLCQFQKRDGEIQIYISEIQNSFATVVENLIDNSGFFKKASRGQLRNSLSEVNELHSLISLQVRLFKEIETTTSSTVCAKTLPTQLFKKFDVCAGELKKIEAKVKGLKCLKKI